MLNLFTLFSCGLLYKNLMWGKKEEKKNKNINRENKYDDYSFEQLESLIKRKEIY